MQKTLISEARDVRRMYVGSTMSRGREGQLRSYGASQSPIKQQDPRRTRASRLLNQSPRQPQMQSRTRIQRRMHNHIMIAAFVHVCVCVPLRLID